MNMRPEPSGASLIQTGRSPVSLENTGSSLMAGRDCAPSWVAARQRAPMAVNNSCFMCGTQCATIPVCKVELSFEYIFPKPLPETWIGLRKPGQRGLDGLAQFTQRERFGDARTLFGFEERAQLVTDDITSHKDHPAARLGALLAQAFVNLAAV